MKGENRLKILEFLEKSGHFIEDMFFIFSLPYGTSLNKGLKLLANYQEKREVYEIDRKEKLRFNDLLYRLKKDGLVEEIKKNNGHFLKITPKGKERLINLRIKKSEYLFQPKYAIKKENSVKIIIFDIPETEKRKRFWIRFALKNLDFNMLQKSVWIGKTKLPEEFIYHLRKYNLLSYVEIFEISKVGSLKQLSL